MNNKGKKTINTSIFMQCAQNMDENLYDKMTENDLQ